MLLAIGAPIFVLGVISMVAGHLKSRALEKETRTKARSRLSTAGGWLIFVGGALLAVYYFTG